MWPLNWQILFGKLLTPLAGESNYVAPKNIGAVAAMFRVITATEGNSIIPQARVTPQPRYGKCYTSQISKLYLPTAWV